MRRHLAWAMILLLAVALAVPAAATPRAAGTGSVYGKIIDSTTGKPFDLSAGGTIAVDVFNLSSMARNVVWITGSPAAQYNFGSLTAGTYKIRFRYWNGVDDLAGYRWYATGGSFDTANPFTIVAGAALKLNITLKPMTGAPVSGTLAEQGSGLPLTAELCYFVEMFEASGISLGWITAPDALGKWALPQVPPGRWTALAYYSTFDASCGTSPAHLDTWYRGASGWPLHQGNLVAHAFTFGTARTFAVVAGSPVGGLTLRMPPAPTCRGKVPTIFGTTLADEIAGTPGRDIIAGLAGDDRVTGFGGNDLICGGAGDDVIDAGAGTDVVDGGAGQDKCKNAEKTFNCP